MNPHSANGQWSIDATTHGAVMKATPVSRAFLAALACMFSCVGCEDLGKEVSASGPLVPLTPGNSWQYLVHASGSSRTDTATVSIEAESAFVQGSVTYPFAVWHTSLSGSPSPFIFFFHNDAHGLQQVGLSAPGDTLLTLTLALKCPVAEGESWEVPVIEYDDYARKLYVARTRRVDCAGINVPLETPAGRFSCILYHWRERPADDIAGDWDYYEWWAPQVGFVAKRAGASNGLGTIFATTLYKYELKGGFPLQ
jgi:hypothetical protein